VENCLGSFHPSFIAAFLSGICVHCGKEISDWAIFGNALVIKKSDSDWQRLMEKKDRSSQGGEDGTAVVCEAQGKTPEVTGAGATGPEGV